MNKALEQLKRENADKIAEEERTQTSKQIAFEQANKKREEKADRVKKEELDKTNAALQKQSDGIRAKFAEEMKKQMDAERAKLAELKIEVEQLQAQKAALTQPNGAPAADK